MASDEDSGEIIAALRLAGGKILRSGKLPSLPVEAVQQTKLIPPSTFDPPSIKCLSSHQIYARFLMLSGHSLPSAGRAVSALDDATPIRCERRRPPVILDLAGTTVRPTWERDAYPAATSLRERPSDNALTAHLRAKDGPVHRSPHSRGRRQAFASRRQTSQSVALRAFHRPIARKTEP